MTAAYYTSTGTAIVGVSVLVVFIVAVYLWGKWPKKPKPDYHMWPAHRLRKGDLVDLYRDPYADPDVVLNQATSILTDSPPINSFEFELAKVIEDPLWETNECVVVEFDCTTVGFPPEHRLKVSKINPLHGAR